MKKHFIILILSVFCLNLNAQCWDKASAGGSHCIAIDKDGSLWSWGRNDKGQLGTAGIPNDKSTDPIKVGNSNDWEIISAGNSHNIALKSDKTLWAWGNNESNQLGYGSSNSNIPIQIGADNDWKFIAAGSEYSLAIKDNGTLWAWGLNNKSQLGNNSNANITTPTQIGEDTNWSKVAGGTNHTLAIKTNGTLWAWGENTSGQLGNGANDNQMIPIQIGDKTNWENVSANNLNSIAINSDGEVYTWGDNVHGQIGDGSNVSKNIPILVLNNLQSGSFLVSNGSHHSLAIKNDGTLWAWGGNASGQLGDGTAFSRANPVQENSSAVDWIFVQSRTSHNIGMKSDGTIYTWGANLNGQLGIGTSGTPVNTPTPIACHTLDRENFTLEGKLSVYPNPVLNELILNTNDQALFNRITITDSFGKIIYEKEKNIDTINVEGFTSGLYLIRAYSNRGNYIGKFIKSR